MSRNFSIGIFILISFVALGRTATPGALAQDAYVKDAGLKADEAKLQGPCPLTVKFTGYVTATGPGTVNYTFTRSDGATGPVLSLTFKGAGTQRVTTSWTLGDPSSLPAYDGWQAIKILSPNVFESNHEMGRFAIGCAQSASSTPAGAKSKPDKTQPEMEKLRVEQQRKAEKDAAVLKAFSERLRPRLEETARRLGFDIKAAQDEMTAIAQETDADKQRTRIEEYARKYDPQYKKLIQASGIDVASERRQLITALGLNPAKVKPSDSLTLEVQGDDQPASNTPVEIPPDEGTRKTNQDAVYFSRVSFPQFETATIVPPFVRPMTWGDGTHFIDLTLGRTGATTRTVNWGGSSDSGTMIFGRFNLNAGIRRIRVTADIDATVILVTFASLAYASAESFTGLNVECGGVTIGNGSISLGRVIAPVFGAPTLFERQTRVVELEFRPEFVPGRQCLVGVSGASIAGGAGVFAGASGSALVKVNRLIVRGW